MERERERERGGKDVSKREGALLSSSVRQRE